MLLVLFSALWGAMFSLLLCAPYSYYPLFLIITGASIVMYILSKKFSKLKNKYIYLYSFILFFIAYMLCSYMIFKPADFHYSDTGNINKDKKAVIFYCEGEMEKYTPYYANGFFHDKPLILKPFCAMKVKEIYRQIGVNTKNKELINIANEVKNSLLNYKPYYFYISFANYVPDIRDSIHFAIADGCSEITILNYTADPNLEKKINSRVNLEDLKSKGINIKFTEPVYSSNIFKDYTVLRIVNMPFTWDGILLIDDETPTSLNVKTSLMDFGYKDHQIIIGKNIKECIDILKANGASDILYVNLRESSSGINSDIIIPENFVAYSSDLKITGIQSWGYDKKLVKASIDVLITAEGK